LVKEKILEILSQYFVYILATVVTLGCFLTILISNITIMIGTRQYIKNGYIQKFSKDANKVIWTKNVVYLDDGTPIGWVNKSGDFVGR